MPEIQPKDVNIKSLSGIHLWHAPMSSCSQRVRIALAEMGKSFTSHIINLENDEHATAEYQAIHPKGLVPAFVEDGRLFIESVDIIAKIAGEDGELTSSDSLELLPMADAAQLDLKLLTFEFLFRSGRAPEPAAADAFQKTHRNDWLKQFRIDYANGFDKDRLDAAVNRTYADFRHLDQVLSDGREYLDGATFSIVDIAWMPNFHRMQLMGWPFDTTPNLQRWFDTVSKRPSYKEALLNWQLEVVPGAFSEYTRKRRKEGTDVRAYGDLKKFTNSCSSNLLA